jgi:hypothetical protein
MGGRAQKDTASEMGDPISQTRRPSVTRYDKGADLHFAHDNLDLILRVERLS